MKHAVVCSARYLMGAYLGLGRVRDLKDIASGLTLCSSFIQVIILVPPYLTRTGMGNCQNDLYVMS
jgi:hypothetical protein